MRPISDDLTVSIDSSLPDHRKVHELADKLGVPNLTALGMILTLWCRARRHAPDGDITDVTPRTLLAWIGHKQATFEAFACAGIIDVHEDGHRVIHGFKERGYAEYDARRQMKKETDAKRQSRWRRNADVTRDIGVTGALRNADVTRDIGDPSPPFPPPPHPPSLSRPPAREEQTTPPPLARRGPPSASPSLATPPKAPKAPKPPKAPKAPSAVGPVIELWNAAVVEIGGVMTPAKSTTNPKRATAVLRVVREGLLAQSGEVLAGLRSDPSLHAGGRSGWRPTLDWFLRPGRWQEYAERGAAPNACGDASFLRPAQPSSRAARNAAEIGSVDWEAINRERGLAGLDASTAED